MTTTLQAKVGDRVIYRRKYGEMPVETTITKVTPKGWVRVACDNGPVFKPGASGTWRDHYPVWVSPGPDERTVIPWSQAAWDRLVEQHNQNEAQKKAREEERARREREREEEKARQMAEVRAAMPQGLEYDLGYTMEDGSRLVVLRISTKPELKERKGFDEVLIVRLRDEKQWLDGVAMVVPYVTYANKSTQSFPSCYGYNGFATDEEALWAVVRDQYHSW